MLVAADGRNSTVARLCNLMPRKGPIGSRCKRTAVAGRLRRSHRAAALAQGYSGQAPVGEGLLNLCLVSRPNDLPAVKPWAEK